jgi:hypothetical protein
VRETKDAPKKQTSGMNRKLRMIRVSKESGFRARRTERIRINRKVRIEQNRNRGIWAGSMVKGETRKGRIKTAPTIRKRKRFS